MNSSSSKDVLFLRVTLDGQIRDVRCRGSKVAEIAKKLNVRESDEVINADGGELVHSLHDHHIHLYALAAIKYSVPCGPPEVQNEADLQQSLELAHGEAWIRGVGYHESVAGELTANQLDRMMNQRPVRIQHRSGRVWFLNSAAKCELGLQKSDSNQLYRQDNLLREKVSENREIFEHLRLVSQELASYGITHVTDATPTNHDETRIGFEQCCPFQKVKLMGGADLSHGHFKIILDDYNLMELGELVSTIQSAHQSNRCVAIHCVSQVEVVFALAAIEEAGFRLGDRLEHGMVMSTEVIAKALSLGVTVSPNPGFIFSRGDQYLQDADPRDIQSLLPLSSLEKSSIHLLGGSDAPFGDVNPWCAMQGAVDRITREGNTLTASEGVSPEIALGLYSEEGINSSHVGRSPSIGDSADLCLLNSNWEKVQENLRDVRVQATVLEGQLTYRNGSKANTTPTD